MAKKKKQIIYSILFILLVLQAAQINKINPPVELENDFLKITNPTEEISNVFLNACYDCHSFHTNYPWYSYTAPASWIIKKHIDEARKHVNFSNWGNYSAEKQQLALHECAEEIEEGEMPLKLYRKAHKEANFNKDIQAKLVIWISDYLNQKTENE